jgi:hypothetical protein
MGLESARRARIHIQFVEFHNHNHTPTLLLNWYATLASLPVLPALGSTTNLVLTTLICHASLAELTKLTNILSF